LVLRLLSGASTLVSSGTSLEPIASSGLTGARLSQQRLGIPTAASPGRYQASLEVWQGGVVAGALPIGLVSVVQGSSSVAIDRALVSVGAELDEDIRLEGYTLGGATMTPRGVLDLRLCWSASGPIDLSYSVFVHVLDGDGRIVAQDDGIPAGGASPTSTWASGSVVLDAHEIALSTTLAPGAYRVIAGLYDPFSGRRVAVLQAPGATSRTDSVQVAEILVRQ
jgi:hypothetical protein